MFSFGRPDYGAAQAHITELMKERDDFIEASKAQARRLAELEASYEATKEAHGAALEQLEVQHLIAEHRLTRINELEREGRHREDKIGKLRSAVRVLWSVLQNLLNLSSEASGVLEEIDGMLVQPLNMVPEDEQGDAATVDSALSHLAPTTLNDALHVKSPKSKSRRR